MTGSDIRRQFAQVLHASLSQRYGRSPSADRLARDFSLYSDTPHAISRETARKWLRGIAFPDLERLAFLIRWLELDMSLVCRVPATASIVKPKAGEAMHPNLAAALMPLGDDSLAE